MTYTGEDYSGIMKVKSKVEFGMTPQYNYEYKDNEGNVVTEMINAGVYSVTATLKPGQTFPNYDLPEKLTATLTINKAEYTLPENVTFNDNTFDYDGNEHTITVNNLPTGLAVDYAGTNVGTDAGTYNAVATFRFAENDNTLSKNYEMNTTITKTATLIINKVTYKLPENVTFEDSTVMYDKNPHTIAVNNLPEGITVDYAGTNTATTVGQHIAVATFGLNSELARNYSSVTPTTMNATLTIEAISSIRVVTAPTATIFGDELNFAGATLEVIKTNGTTTSAPENIPLTADMVSGYNSRVINTQTVTVSYGMDVNGNSVTTTFNITLQDYIKDIIVSNNDKTEYEYGETISTSQIVAEGIWASGLQASKQIANSELIINNGKPVVADKTGTIEIPVVYRDTVTGTSISKTAKANVKGAVIYGNSSIMSEDGSQNVYMNNVTITWNTREKATIVYPNGSVIEREGQPVTLNMVGTYTITVGKIVRTFEVKELKLEAVNWNPDTRTLMINDRNSIASATIVCELENGTVFEGDLFDFIGNTSTYVFTEIGYYYITIIETNGSKTLIEINDEF